MKKLITILASLLLLNGCDQSTDTTQDTTLDEHLFAYWNFETTETIVDQKGNVPNGVKSNTTASTGISGNALSFSASQNSNVVISRNSFLEPSSELTISVWVNISSTQDNSETTILRKATDQGEGYNLSWCKGSDKITWNLDYRHATLVDNTSNANRIGWTHIATTTSVTEKKTNLYINGELVDEADISIDEIKHSGDLYIGGGQFGNHSCWLSGTIDELKMYDKYLTAEEIKTLYNLNK